MKLEVDKFYSWSSFVTVAGMASMLWVVAGTLSKAFAWAYPSWFPLMLALGFVVLGDFGHRPSSTRLTDLPARIPLWIVNACLVYTTAIGGADTLTPTGATDDAQADEEVAEEPPAAAEPEPAVEAPANVVTPHAGRPVAPPIVEPPTKVGEGAQPQLAAPDPADTPVTRAPRSSTTTTRVRRPARTSGSGGTAPTGFNRMVNEPLF